MILPWHLRKSRSTCNDKSSSRAAVCYSGAFFLFFLMFCFKFPFIGRASARWQFRDWLSGGIRYSAHRPVRYRVCQLTFVGEIVGDGFPVPYSGVAAELTDK